ncbi:MAG: choice-of-anchor J domain-containing protein [Paludibacteraceae bacterium]
MKKSLFLLLLVCTVSLRANTTVADPDLGNGRLVVCAQNLRNYYVTNTAQLDDVFNGKNGGLDGKTERIVNAFLHLNADIYAVCEIECLASTVAHLTDALNTAAGTTRYGYVSDPQESSERTQSAFIYRTDRVKPYRDNLPGSTDPYQYSHRMRIQTFEEISTGERFILSMNHFKAKEGDNDNTDANRERNANDLLSKLSVITYDPDVLIMGDLNCTVSESPLQIILNAGYTEMLLEYNPNAYSHYYSGYELIDHAFANGTMKTQIKGADVYHINTSSRKGDSNWYSDHDPVLVSLSLNANGDHPDNPDPEPDPNPDGDCTPVDYKKDFKEGLDGFEVITPQGSVSWNSNANYGAVINGYNKTAPMESWLISPAFDLQDAESATIAFRHNIYYDNSNGQYAQLQTLWYTTDYDEAAPAFSAWHQLTIPEYGVKTWVDCEVLVPAEAQKDGFRFAFKYTAESSSAANYWEIDSASLTTTCNSSQGIDQPDADDSNRQTHPAQPCKFVKDGTLYIQVGTTTYTLSGYLLR